MQEDGTCYLADSGGGAAFHGARDEECFDLFLEHLHDPYGIRELEARGRIFLIEKNTRALVVSTTAFTAKVRILEGPLRGKLAVVAAGTVRASPLP